MRLYNGCPDNELAAIWKAQDDARAALAKVGLHATYFPMEGKWMVSTSIHTPGPWREITGFHDTLVEAAHVALHKIGEVKC